MGASLLGRRPYGTLRLRLLRWRAGWSGAGGGGGGAAGRRGATRGGGFVVSVRFNENDQPSKLPSGGLRFMTPHWLYSQAPPLGECQ
ncbi:hypothetical protein [Actinoalloteichus caeruleus]|uniref:Uncharacterized protein n=1 Tax=Actinoalloteichus caeruleus DSM 43889 TaxID=1120930 RepID=A0ABT1JPV6_ACTCY|nr:hypothetical protein [Actinoalloteichus caeruleus]MCP2334567.1 hypothetical protein [Actinoalloteichus caeruleus DSM 43889]